MTAYQFLLQATVVALAAMRVDPLRLAILALSFFNVGAFLVPVEGWHLADKCAPVRIALGYLVMSRS